MYILGIDTSCDDTSAAVLKYCIDSRKFHIKSNIISSQIKVHSEYGGVVPEIASREHLKNIRHVMEMALNTAEINEDDINLVAVTAGPGLLGSLIVGYSFAKGFAVAKNLPLITVDHIKAHNAANMISPYEISYPAVALTISGGHSSLSVIKEPTKAEFIGGTIDDAVGELFDKISRHLKLPYPGGPVLDKLSREGAPEIKFPRPLIKENNYNFSFSGLKTAVINYMKKTPDYNIPDLANSMTAAICDVLLKKTGAAVIENKARTVMISGGVACNSMIREAFKEYGEKNKINILIPPPVLCTDNGVMIGILGTLNYVENGENNIKNTDVYPTTRW